MDWPDDPPRAPLYESYSGPESGFERFQLHAMGTDNVLLLRAAGGVDCRKAAQAAFRVIQELEERLSKFLPESEVSLLNRLAAHRPVSVGEDLLELLERSREAWEITGGAFDPTVGPLLEAWGLVDMQGRVPEKRELERLREVAGMDHVQIDRRSGTVSFDRPEVSVDLGAIGKGYAVDAAVRVLREEGVAAGAVISGRSTIATWGAPPGEERWRIEVADPEEPDEGLLALEVEAGTLSSSGAYERRVRHGAEVYGHVMDPHTGQPTRALLGASVWTRSALLGDVLSTSLFVLGGEATGRDGPAERLTRAWTPPGEEPRASFLWIEPDPGVWGGHRVRTRHLGSPGFVEPPRRA